MYQGLNKVERFLMRLDIHHISKEYCELSIDEIHTGTLNLEEAKELALHLIYIATELLEKEDR
jgi:hypothetical protein